MNVWRVFNRQKTRALNGILFRKIARCLLEELRAHRQYEIGVHLVNAPEMAEINERFLNHTGSTDVITFDHKTSAQEPGLHGEIYICIDDAVAQARQFGVTWQQELARYLVHGILHLEGHDDLEPAARRKMKRAENALVMELSSRFALGKLGGVKNVTRNK